MNLCWHHLKTLSFCILFSFTPLGHRLGRTLETVWVEIWRANAVHGKLAAGADDTQQIGVQIQRGIGNGEFGCRAVCVWRGAQWDPDKLQLIRKRGRKQGGQGSRDWQSFGQSFRFLDSGVRPPPQSILPLAESKKASYNTLQSSCFCSCAVSKSLPADSPNSSIIKLWFVRCIRIATHWHPKLFNNHASVRAVYQNRYPLTP